MSTRDRLFLAVLMVDAAVLAVLELLFLPLRLDGYILPNFAGGLALPLSSLVAAVTMPLLVAAAARLSQTLLVAAAPLAAWVVTIGVFGMFGPGGDIVLIADWRSLLLFACGTLPATVVLGRVLAATLTAPQ
jgi:hypothetical protein